LSPSACSGGQAEITEHSHHPATRTSRALIHAQSVL